MARFRVGRYVSLIYSCEYAIQKKKWWGWSTWDVYYRRENAIADAKWLEEQGHSVDWYI